MKQGLHSNQPCLRDSVDRTAALLSGSSQTTVVSCPIVTAYDNSRPICSLASDILGTGHAPEWVVHYTGSQLRDKAREIRLHRVDRFNMLGGTNGHYLIS